MCRTKQRVTCGHFSSRFMLDVSSLYVLQVCVKIELGLRMNYDAFVVTVVWGILTHQCHQGCSGAEIEGDGVPLLFS